MNEITISMSQYMKNHPKLKYIFFGGKGGVGKTSVACASAIALASGTAFQQLALRTAISLLRLIEEEISFGENACFPVFLLPFLRDLRQRFNTISHPTASVACYPAS